MAERVDGRSFLKLVGGPKRPQSPDEIRAMVSRAEQADSQFDKDVLDKQDELSPLDPRAERAIRESRNRDPRTGKLLS